MGALAAGALGDQQPVPLKRRGVVLDHLHVHQRAPDPVGHRDPVASADQRVRRGVVDLPVPAAGEDHGLRREELHRPVADVAGDAAGDVPLVVAHQRGGEPLLVAVDLVVLHQLLVEHVQDRLARDVGHVVGAGGGGAAEGARAELALFVAVERDAEVLEVEDLLRRLAAHDLDRVLVAEVVRALDGVEGVRLPGVLGVQRRVDPALGRVRVRADGVDLGHDPDRGTLFGSGQRCALSRESGSYYEDIVLRHRKPRHPI